MAKDAKPRPGLTELPVGERIVESPASALAPPNAAGLAEQKAIASAPPENHELAALRAQVDALTQLVKDGAAREARLDQKLQELATVRASITLDQDYETWKQWAALSAEEKTQIAADKRWGHEDAPKYRVSLPGHPSVVIPVPAGIGAAKEEVEHIAIGRYNALCGILAVVNNNADRPLKHAVAPA